MIFNKTSIRNHHGNSHDHGYIEHSHLTNVENREQKTLNILLVYWLNHNQSYGKEYKEWAEKAREMGKEETAKNIEDALKYLEKVNESLSEAKKNM